MYYKIIIGIVTLFILVILYTINDWLRSKIDYIEFNMYETKPIPIETRTNCTTEFLNLCNRLMDVEIMKVMRDYIALNNRYEMSRIDDDSKKIATNVFEGLKKEALNDKSLLVDDIYIMKYISSETILQLLNVVLDYNKSL